MKYINYFKKEEWRLILLVGGGYFINLYLLRGQNALGPEIAKAFWEHIDSEDAVKFQNSYLIFNALGLLVGTFIYGFYADKKSRIKTLSWSIFLHLVACIITLIVVSANFPENQTESGVKRVMSDLISRIFYVWRFFTGVIFAGSFGVGMTIIIETLPRSKRIWGSAWITALGMLGVVVYVLLAWYFGSPGSPQYTINITMGVGLVMSFILLTFQWHYQPSLLQKEFRYKTVNQGILKFWFSFFSNQVQWKNLLLLALIYLPIQFGINFIIPKLSLISSVDNPSSTPSIDINIAYLCYYLAFFVSVFLAAWIYDKVQRSSIVIFLGLVFQAIAIVVSLNLIPIFIPFQVKCLFLGLSGGVWWLVTLIAIENYGAMHRASAGVFVSNLSRVGIVLLAFGTNLKTDTNLKTGDDSEIRTATLLIVITIVGIAFIAALFVPKKFSPRISNNIANDLLTKKTILDIRTAQDQFLNTTKNIKTYLQGCTQALQESIFDHFNSLRFVFFCIEDNSTKGFNILRGNCEKDESLFDNPKESPSLLESEYIRDLSTQLLNAGKSFSFTNEILRSDVPGLLIYQARIPFGIKFLAFFIKENDLPEGYKIFNLDKISLSMKQMKRFHETKPFDENNSNILEQLSEMSQSVPEEALIKIFDRKIGMEEMMQLKFAVLLHKLDAFQYKRGYFNYYVAPRYKEANGIASLTTNFPASRDQLHRLADIVTLVMTSIYVLKAKDTTFQDVVDQSMHNQNSILSAIHYNLDRIEYAKDKEILAYQLGLVRFNFDNIYETNQLFYALVKADYKYENIDAIKNPKVKQCLNTTKGKALSEIIKTRLKIIEDALENVFLKEGQYENEENQYRLYIEEKLIPSVQANMSNVYIDCVQMALHVILNDILTNAVRYNTHELEISITIGNTKMDDLPDVFSGKQEGFLAKDYKTLAITNNGRLLEVYYNTMLGMMIDDETIRTSSRSLGISTILRILQYNGLGKSGKQWYFTPKKNCYKDDKTTVFLLIPNDDFA